VSVDEPADLLAIEAHRDSRPIGFNFVSMPLAHGRRGSRRRKGVNRAGIVQRVVEAIRVGIEAGVVDLDLVTLVDWDRPVIARVRKADEHAGVIGRGRRMPFLRRDHE
jgi:hypothetical protein